MIKNNPVFLQANWNAPVNIQTCITTAIDDFNVASHVNYPIEQVTQNRNILKQKLPSNPLWLNQIHSNNVINGDNYASYPLPEADAIICQKQHQVAVIMTADCLPILLTNDKGEFVAAIHAGWRGLYNRIIENTLNQLTQFKSEQMLAFIGPAICQNCFEIDPQIRDQFISQHYDYTQYFTPGKNNKYHANLRNIAKHILLNAGLHKNNITNHNICTKCNTDWFYSYRANPATGRIATLIWKT